MGQYYVPVILNGTGGKVIGSFSPYDYQNGMKLMEHSYIGNQLVDAVIAKALYVSAIDCFPLPESSISFGILATAFKRQS